MSAAAAIPIARASRSGSRSASGQDSVDRTSTSGHASSGRSATAPLVATASASTIGGSSEPGTGEQVRQRPSVVFQQLPHVYWRQVMQKLKVLWNASSWWEVALRSSSLRASAIASEKELSSCST